MVYPSTTLYPSETLWPSDETALVPLPVPVASKGPLVLCDSEGTELAELEVSHTIRFERSRAWSVKFHLGYDQRGASDLLGLLSDGLMPTLRAYRDTALIFNGWWAPQQEVADGTEQDGITCEFRTSFARLETRCLRSTDTLVFVATDAVSIARTLLRETNADSPTGITEGTIPGVPTIALDRTYEIGKQIASAIIELTELENGFQFTETVLGPPYDHMSTLNMWAPSDSGRDLSQEIRFEYGENTLRNVLSVQRTVSLPVNRVVVTGGEGTTPVVSDNFPSQALLGVYAVSASYTDITSQSSLDAKAGALLHPSFVQQITFDPGIDLAGPQPIDDYWLRDTIGFYTDENGLTIDMEAEITAIELDRAGDGVESAHRLEFGTQTVQPLVPVRRGRHIALRDPRRVY